MMRKRTATVAVLVWLLGTASCFSMRTSQGGGQVDRVVPRNPDPAAVAVPQPYKVEIVARELTYPTGITFDAEGTPYVVESGYSYGEDFTTPRLLKLNADGTTTQIAAGENGPWNGVAFHDGAFFVAEGGASKGGRVLRITRDGTITPLTPNLPTVGDHHLNGPTVGPDGMIYFSIGTITNSGVVGEDSAEFGWLKRAPQAHDIPCKDITLTGSNYKSGNPLTDDPKDSVETGAFLPFGTPSTKDQVIKGQIPCHGAIFKLPPSGGNLELVAWGFRNPFGLAFGPGGALFTTENSYDMRGSRPVFGTEDHLYKVEPGLWYGWPEYAGWHTVYDPRWLAPEKDKITPVLASWPNDPPEPIAMLAVHSSSNGFAFSTSEKFGHVGQAFIAQFGDQTPITGKAYGPVGFKVVRVNIDTHVVETFATNEGPADGPASGKDGRGLERPNDAKFSPDGNALYIVDFGILRMDDKGSHPHKGTGVVWRITRKEGA